MPRQQSFAVCLVGLLLAWPSVSLSEETTRYRDLPLVEGPYEPDPIATIRPQAFSILRGRDGLFALLPDNIIVESAQDLGIYVSYDLAELLTSEVMPGHLRVVAELTSAHVQEAVSALREMGIVAQIGRPVLNSPVVPEVILSEVAGKMREARMLSDGPPLITDPMYGEARLTRFGVRTLASGASSTFGVRMAFRLQHGGGTLERIYTVGTTLGVDCQGFPNTVLETGRARSGCLRPGDYDAISASATEATAACIAAELKSRTRDWDATKAGQIQAAWVEERCRIRGGVEAAGRVVP